LKTDYKEDATINDNLKLSVKILLKTLDSATPSPERIELSVLKKGDNDKVVHTTLTDAEVFATCTAECGYGCFVSFSNVRIVIFGMYVLRGQVKVLIEDIEKELEEERKKAEAAMGDI